MLAIERHQTSSDGSHKVLWRLPDGYTVESVILPRALKQRKKLELWKQEDQGEGVEAGRYTACVSSQVGCAMACDFCLTGKQGFTRNLKAQEIIDQVWGLKKFKPISNIVFMGMGEPLQNIDEVVQAIHHLRSPRGLGLSKRKILVSTSGVVSAFPKLAETGVRLAISLNATTDELRSQIMPINRKHPIRELMSAALDYGAEVSQTVMLEYVLLKGLNDTPDDQSRLFEIARGWDCKVNLIPYNPFDLPGMEPGPYQRPEAATVKAFQHSLVSRGVTATVRYSGGDDISAACGQLKSENAKVLRGFSTLGKDLEQR
ncbi:MAG: 23S rRNA (adenine(2503)-C(2))-methyltransferase RlmN [Bdellovibrionales bacterium]|nr:23S rRNA (adenine(2503)-C(2))-methyltransferase RlmN [Bdellovibrionales bacterium]